MEAQFNGVETRFRGAPASGPQRVPPLVLGVSGLPGAGSTTLARALTERFGVATVVEGMDVIDGVDHGERRECPPPDLLIRVIGAQARAADRAAIAAAVTPVVVVAGKADTRLQAAGLARDAARMLAQPVYPVSGMLAGVHLDDGDVELLRRWQRSGIRVPTVAADFAGVEVQRDRARMMARLGRTGLVAALDRLAERPETTQRELTADLRARSGMDALVAPIAAAGGRISDARRVRRLAALRLIAARRRGRVEDEQRLIAGPVG